MTSFLIICGAILGGTGMFAGSFATHAIARLCSAPAEVRNWDAAVRCWLLHSLVILVVSVLLLAPQANPGRGLLMTAGVLFVTGTVLYSGCLVALTLSHRIIFAMIAPLGTVALLVGWVLLACVGFLIGS